jgi:DNA-binding GntR family transcriptional regulator
MKLAQGEALPSPLPRTTMTDPELLDAPPSADTVGDLVQQLERMILAGELEAGAKLREVALADTLGVRRGPLREAVRILEGRRLLERTPHAGVSVIAPTLEDCEQLLVTREALEGMAARLSAQNMTFDELERLRALEKVMEDGDGAGRAPGMGVFGVGPDTDFHRLIAMGSRNRRIEQLLCEDLYSQLRFFRTRLPRTPRSADQRHGEHRAIIEAIHRRDGDAAEEAMRAHIRRSRQFLVDRLRGKTQS